MDITNETRKPLSIALPGGKKLFLGPGKTGQVTPKALKHPPLAKLIEAGDIKTAEGASTRNDDGGTVARSSSTGYKESVAMRQTGDR